MRLSVDSVQSSAGWSLWRQAEPQSREIFGQNSLSFGLHIKCTEVNENAYVFRVCGQNKTKSQIEAIEHKLTCLQKIKI